MWTDLRYLSKPEINEFLVTWTMEDSKQIICFHKSDISSVTVVPLVLECLLSEER